VQRIFEVRRTRPDEHEEATRVILVASLFVCQRMGLVNGWGTDKRMGASPSMLIAQVSRLGVPWPGRGWADTDGAFFAR